MNNFTKGILVGVSVGLLIAPLKGEETRRLLVERVREWRNSLPEDSRINQCITQASERVASTRENWRGYAQQAASRAKDTGTTFSNKAKQTGQNMASRAKQTSQDMANRAKQAAGFSGSGQDSATTRVIPEA